MTRADRWFIVILIALCCITIGIEWSSASQHRGDMEAVVQVNGKEVKRLLLRQGLRQTYRIDVAGHYNVLQTEGRRIKVSEADCPDLDCLRIGWVSQPGQQIVCLPNRVVVKIVQTNNQLDDITR